MLNNNNKILLLFKGINKNQIETDKNIIWVLKEIGLICKK